VQTQLPKVMLDLDSTNCDLNICGLAKMVDDARRILQEELGVASKHIHIECHD